MIIGTGSIANVLTNSKYFTQNNEIIIYAKGVSNFAETSLLEFEREEKELFELAKKYSKKNIKFIYFSSQSVLCKKKNNYINHKIYIEELIKFKLFDKFLIIRLPNLIDYNKNTLFNQFYKSIKEEEFIKVDKSVKKEFLSIEEIPEILKLLIEIENTTLNIGFNRLIPIINIIDVLSKSLNKKPKLAHFDFEYNYECNYDDFLTIIENKYPLSFNLNEVIFNCFKNRTT